jgi:hypothetical protein
VNLVRRGVAADPSEAALVTAAALRALEVAGVKPPAVWIARGTAKLDSTAAWDHGIALVRVAGPEPEAAARGVAEAVGARIVMSAADLGRLGQARGDGARLAARHELGLWPDEEVEVVLGADRDPTALSARLGAFDELLESEPAIPRRLVLAALTTHTPPLSDPLVRAILHPLTLVEVARSDQAMLDLLRVAAAEIKPLRR